MCNSPCERCDRLDRGDKCVDRIRTAGPPPSSSPPTANRIIPVPSPTNASSSGGRGGRGGRGRGPAKSSPKSRGGGGRGRIPSSSPRVAAAPIVEHVATPDDGESNTNTNTVTTSGDWKVKSEVGHSSGGDDNEADSEALSPLAPTPTSTASAFRTSPKNAITPLSTNVITNGQQQLDWQTRKRPRTFQDTEDWSVFSAEELDEQEAKQERTITIFPSIPQYDEVKVVRIGLMGLSDWVYRSLQRLHPTPPPDSLIPTALSLLDKPICPGCVSPRQRCAVCESHHFSARRSQPSEFEWMKWVQATFTASMFLPKEVVMMEAPDLEGVPMAALRFGLLIGETPAEDGEMWATQTSACVPAMYRAKVPSLSSIINDSTDASPSPSSPSSSSSSSSHSGMGMSMRKSDDYGPPPPITSLQPLPERSRHRVSINDALIRLLGYNREDWHAHMSAVGWHLPFKYIITTYLMFHHL
jgi:hypothetical protein